MEERDSPSLYGERSAVGEGGRKGKNSVCPAWGMKMCVDKGEHWAYRVRKSSCGCEVCVGLAMASCCLWHPEVLKRRKGRPQRAHNRRAPPLGSS